MESQDLWDLYRAMCDLRMALEFVEPTEGDVLLVDAYLREADRWLEGIRKRNPEVVDIREY